MAIEQRADIRAVLPETRETQPLLPAFSRWLRPNMRARPDNVECIPYLAMARGDCVASSFSHVLACLPEGSSCKLRCVKAASLGTEKYPDCNGQGI